MEKEGRIIINVQSPILIRDPSLNGGEIATIRDWGTGMPYIPAGVLIERLRNAAGLLKVWNQDLKVSKILFGDKSSPGMLWIGRADFLGISNTVIRNMILDRGTLFPRDVYDALTVQVDTWYGGERVKARVIAAPAVFFAPFVWKKTPDQRDVAFFSAACAGVKTIGQRADDGLGMVDVKIEGSGPNYLELLGD